MGNPNARPRKTLSISTTKSHSSRSTRSRSNNLSASSPTPSKELSDTVSSTPTKGHMASDNAGSVEDKLVESLKGLDVANDAVIQRPALAFKSFQSGSLVTTHFVPPGQSIYPPGMLPPPLPAPKATPTPEETRAFTPPKTFAHQSSSKSAAPVHRARNHNARRTNRNQIPPTGNLQRIQGVINDMRASSKLTPAQRLALQHTVQSPHPQNAPTGPRNPNSSHQQVARQQPPRKPRTFLTRRDKTYRDIVIRADGVERNMTEVTERYLPSGIPFQESSDKWNPGVYDFVADFKSMKPEEQLNMLAKRQVEIVVDIESAEEDTKDAKKTEAEKSEAALMVADKVEKTESKEGGEKTKTAVINRTTTVIDQLKKLGPEFTHNIKNLTITLDFKSITPISNTAVTTPAPGPKPTPTSPPPANNSPLPSGPDFDFLTKLTEHLNTFPSIERLAVVLKVQSEDNRMPISIKQLTLVLPFYDLGFTNWVVQWKTAYMTRTCPVHGWSMSWLDRERDRIIREQERVSNVVFTRPSVAPFHFTPSP